MLGLSISDVCSSLVYFLGTWLVPKGSMTVGGYGPVYWAAGTTDTCYLSGFFTQAAMAGPFYNATLACYYLLTIYYNWQDSRLKTVQHWFHILPIGWALMTSVIALALKMYGNVDWLCWILPDDRENGTWAQRSFVVFQWVFLFAPLWCCIFFVSGVMFLLWKKMRENERKMEKYRFTARASTSLEVVHVDNTDSQSHGLSQIEKEVLSDTVSPASVGVSSLRKTSEVVLEESEYISNLKMTSNDGVSKKDDDIESQTLATNGDVDDNNAQNQKMRLSFHENVIFNDSNKSPNQNIEPNDLVCDVDTAQLISNDDGDARGFDLENDLLISDISSGGNGSKTTFLQHVLRRLPFSSKAAKERRLSTISINSTSSRRSRLYKKATRSRQIAIQGMLYVCAFYITWLFPTIQRLMELANKKSFVVQFFDSTLLPLQGLFNFIIFIRPRLVAYRKANKKVGFWRAFWRVAWEK